MEHHFNVELAKKIGVDCAVVFNHFVYWIQKNMANEKNFYDGHYWTYNSAVAMVKLFPYYTKKQIERIVNKLVSEGYLIKGNYNQSKYDRTAWYAITDMGITKLPNGNLQVTKREFQNPETVTPIPINNTINNTDSNTNNIKEINKENSFSKQNCQDVIDCLEQNTKRKFRKINDSVRSKFNARIKDGYTIEDIRTAIVNASQNQYHKETGFQYLTPEFFSRPATLDKWSVSTTQTEESNLKPKRIDWSKSKQIDL